MEKRALIPARKKPPPPRPPSNDPLPGASGAGATYFSCPPPAPRVFSARDGDGNDVFVEVPAPVSTVVVGYEFRLRLSGGEDRDADDEATRLLPEVQRRLGEGLGWYMRNQAEDDDDGENCEGYRVDNFRRLLRIDRRRPVARRAGVEDETRIIDLSTSGRPEIDADKPCIPRNDGCFVVHGELDTTYVGYNEAGVRSFILRAVKDEMAKGRNDVRCRGRGRDCDEYGYILEFLGEGSGHVGLLGDSTNSLSISSIVSSHSEALTEDGKRRITPFGAAIMGIMIGMLCLTLTALIYRKKGAFGKSSKGKDNERYDSDTNSESEDKEGGGEEQ